MNKVGLRKIFLTQQYLILDFLKEFFDSFPDFKMFFFYKNTSFLYMRYIYDFFKFFDSINIEKFIFFFNFNFSFIFNKYFKKVQTKKKFRKKIFLKSFVFDYKETYIL